MGTGEAKVRLNPTMVVFGDLVAEQLGEPLPAVARRVVAEQALPDPLEAVTLRLSRLPRNPVSLGAATFALDHFLADREIFGSVSARRAGRAIQ